MDSTYQNTTDQAVGEEKLPAPLEPGAIGALLLFVVIVFAAAGFFIGRHSVSNDYTSCDLVFMEEQWQWGISANAEGCQYIKDLQRQKERYRKMALSPTLAPTIVTPLPTPTPTPTPTVTEDDIFKAQQILRQQVGFDSATLGQLPELRSKIVLATCAKVDEATLRAADKLFSDLEIGIGFVTDAAQLAHHASRALS